MQYVELGATFIAACLMEINPRVPGIRLWPLSLLSAPFHCSQPRSVRNTLGWLDRGKEPGRGPWRPPCLELRWMTSPPENLCGAMAWVRGDPGLPPSWATREDTGKLASVRLDLTNPWSP